MIGLGILTFNRPQFFAVCAASVTRHLADQLDVVRVFNDGSDPEHTQAYEDAYALLPPQASVIPNSTNHGVATAKNALLRSLLEAGCQSLFVMEDDIEVIDPKAVSGYLAACEGSGLQHLSFAAHGMLNRHVYGFQGRHDALITAWPAYVGAYCVYSRESLEKAGLMDEGFSRLNAYEHVAHTLELAKHGYTLPWPQAADATGSEHWLREQPDSLNQSVIRADPLWKLRGERALRYWHQAHPDTYPFGP